MRPLDATLHCDAAALVPCRADHLRDPTAFTPKQRPRRLWPPDRSVISATSPSPVLVSVAPSTTTPCVPLPGGTVRRCCSSLPSAPIKRCTRHAPSPYQYKHFCPKLHYSRLHVELQACNGCSSISSLEHSPPEVSSYQTSSSSPTANVRNSCLQQVADSFLLPPMYRRMSIHECTRNRETKSILASSAQCKQGPNPYNKTTVT
jgi:hypothetical protein